jgi:hypothetical protein
MLELDKSSQRHRCGVASTRGNCNLENGFGEANSRYPSDSLSNVFTQERHSTKQTSFGSKFIQAKFNNSSSLSNSALTNGQIQETTSHICNANKNETKVLNQSSWHMEANSDTQVCYSGSL